jgi:hypothetical protein
MSVIAGINARVALKGDGNKGREEKSTHEI